MADRQARWDVVVRFLDGHGLEGAVCWGAYSLGGPDLEDFEDLIALVEAYAK